MNTYPYLVFFKERGNPMHAANGGVHGQSSMEDHFKNVAVLWLSHIHECWLSIFMVCSWPTLYFSACDFRHSLFSLIGF